MSRYRGPRSKIIKRLGILPGLKTKFSSREKRLPEKDNSSNQGSQYSIRLQTKQKLRYHYGITERKLSQYIKKAKKSKQSTGKILLQLLEMRLDNILYRARITNTISAARQLINHGHVFVNDKRMTIPSYSCKPICKILILNNFNLGQLENSSIPAHLSLNQEDLTLVVQNYINDTEIGLKVNELFVIEYYSRS